MRKARLLSISLFVCMLLAASDSWAQTELWVPQIIGSGRGTGSGEFYEPMDVAVDINGTIYVVEAYNGRVQLFTSAGAYINEYGTAGSGDPGELDDPEGITVRKNETNLTVVYVADTKNYRIQVLTINQSDLGNYSWSSFGQRDYPGSPDNYIYFNEPKDVEYDEAGSVYVLDYDSQGIYLFNHSNLNLTVTAANRTSINTSLTDALGMKKRGDRLYVADTGNDTVKIYTLTGSLIWSFGGTGTGAGYFRNLSDIALDEDGNIWVSDTGNHRIQVFDSVGTYMTSFGSQNCSTRIYSNPEEAKGEFCGPRGMDIRGDRLYVADTGNHRLQVFNTSDLGSSSCSLPGDTYPCGEVTLSEVLQAINLWSMAQATLSQVVEAINAWASV